MTGVFAGFSIAKILLLAMQCADSKASAGEERTPEIRLPVSSNQTSSEGGNRQKHRTIFLDPGLGIPDEDAKKVTS